MHSGFVYSLLYSKFCSDTWKFCFINKKLIDNFIFSIIVVNFCGQDSYISHLELNIADSCLAFLPPS